VKVECLLFAFISHEWEGLWGGWSAKQRRALGAKGRAALVAQADPRVAASLTTPDRPEGWSPGSVRVRLTPKPTPKPAAKPKPKSKPKPEPDLASWRFLFSAGNALVAAERKGKQPH
jgi:hypothetical protein